VRAKSALCSAAFGYSRALVIALLIGRFHAVTSAQARWLQSLGSRPDVTRIVCVLTSADHAGTRRNPLAGAVREQMLRPCLAAAGRPFEIVRVANVANNDRWVEHVVAEVERAVRQRIAPDTARLYSANRDVDALFAAKGFPVVSEEARGLTPHELVQRIVDGREWKSEAAPSTIEVYEREGVVARLKAIYAQRLLNDDGELGHARDFGSYGAQMDASLKQKLEDLLPWVVPGRIVDKGCGTGMLLVELSRLYPDSALVGVDLSREFLRRCDENTYAGEDVTFAYGNIIERQLEPGTATTVIFSSVMHEVHSYSGFDRGQIDRALANAAAELKTGGQVLIRDGVSPGEMPWRLKLLDDATRAQFERFAKEFKHGAGAPHVRVGPDEVRLSAHLANEFLCKKDYLKNWHIEVHEEYGALTLDGWKAALERTGYEAVERRAYVNGWIAANRYAGTAELFDDATGARLDWPATNAVIVGRKR
jgi:SAM-dependent methyltransferase/nicotinamide mononucleotide adenylyltransferase